MRAQELVLEQDVRGGLAGASASAAAERTKLLSILGVFAVMLAYLSGRHEVFGDEAQAWLIARDSRTILEMLGHLRYEGHPSVWYLLLYLPAHLGANFIWIRLINYVFSVALAWLILSERRLPMRLRFLAVFGIYVTFHIGLLARSYTLSALLLVGAVRSLRANRPKHWLGMVLLFLAINAHFLAIPAAAGIFVWLYWLAPGLDRQSLVIRLREKQFWGSVALMALAVLCCYLTVRPASDGATPEYALPGNTLIDYLGIALGRLWSYATPFIPEMLSGATRQMFVPELHPSWIAAFITILYWTAIVLALPGRLSRWFFASITALWMVAVLASVRAPSPHHASTLFVILLISVMLGSEGAEDKSLLPSNAARFVLTFLFGAMSVMAVEYCLLENNQLFSSAESTGSWLRQQGLLAKPLIFAPDHDASVILAENNIKSAYYATCSCDGSFVVFNYLRNEERQIAVDEVKTVWAKHGEAPIVLTHWKMKTEDLAQLHMSLLYTSQHGFFWPYEDLFVYGQQSALASATGR